MSARFGLIHHLSKITRSFSTTRTPDLEIDNLIIGGGVVGLALGERLTRTRPNESTIVAEKNGRCGEETSARNSEVIHGGFYYPLDSLKTKLCIRGNRLLYELLSKTAIPYNKVGKLVVAQSPEQKAYLETLHEKAAKLGVETRLLDSDQVHDLEPAVRAHAALLSPSTGIIDSHGLMDYLEQQIAQNAGDIALSTRVTSIRPATDNGYLVGMATAPDPADSTLVKAKRVFNCAGLYADKVSNLLLPDRYRLHYARGHYFSYSTSTVIRHLIYPCPEKNLAGLGTHLTLDLAGRIKFGPDVQYIDRPDDYNFPDDADKVNQFAQAIQTYLPSVDKEKLHPDYAGIRPKLAGPGEPFKDFIIQEETKDGYRNFFSLVGIESPGLTSSLAIAEYVDSMIQS